MTAESQLIDRVAIRELIDRSSDVINHQEWTALVALFTDDAVWERLPPTPWKLEGRDAIRTFLGGNVDKLDVLLYTVSATAVDIQGPEQASARSTMSELIRIKKTGAGLHVVGTYDDQFIKKNGKWWFTRRTIRPRYEDDIAGPTRLFGRTTPAPSAMETIRK